MRQPAIPKLSELSTAGRADLAQPDRRSAGVDCRSSYGAAIGAGAKRTDQAGSGQVRLAAMAAVRSDSIPYSSASGRPVNAPLTDRESRPIEEVPSLPLFSTCHGSRGVSYQSRSLA
jgi:hypothetical protein